MAILKFKDENNQWQDLVALRGRDGVIQYQAGNGITIDGNVISAIQQDLSDYYTKAQVNGLINAIETVQLEPVAELPATGEPNVIYLVPKTGETGDVYDEYVYINNAWERIGSTAVDLSNYYTKSEVNIIANAKLPYYKLSLTTIISNGKVNLNATDLEALSAIFTDAYSKEYTAINILMTATYNNGKVMQVLLMPSSQRGQDVISNNLTSYVFEYFCNQGYVGYPADQSYYNVIFGWLNVNNIVWNDGVCTVGGCQFNGTLNTIPTSQGVLLKNNTFSYNPTANYHPATKKYVDDAVASVPSGGSIEDIYVVTCGHRFDSASFNVTDDGSIAEMMNTYWPKYLQNSNCGGLVIWKDYTGATNGTTLIGQIRGNKIHIQWPWLQQNYGLATRPYGSVGVVQINGSWNSNTETYTVSSVSWTRTDYVPEKDWNPANKKYVDDAIAGAGSDCLLLEFKAPTGINHMSDNSYTYTSSDLTADQLAVITDIATNPTKKAILFKYTNNSNENYLEVLLTYQSVGTSSSTNTYKFAGTRTDHDLCRLGHVVMDIVWNTQNDTLTSLSISTYTATGTKGIPTLSDIDTKLSNYLSKTNMTSYTPTGNYHPATKKYVDDNIHTHANKTLLDTITSGDVSDWNSAVTNSHTHTNKTVLDGISSSDITNWNKTHIYSGTSTPGAGTGENGDIYVKYTA